MVGMGHTNSHPVCSWMVGAEMTKEEKRERILHAVKNVAELRHKLDTAIDELTKEVLSEN